jgi:hypothetical protein
MVSGKKYIPQKLWHGERPSLIPVISILAIRAAVVATSPAAHAINNLRLII